MILRFITLLCVLASFLVFADELREVHDVDKRSVPAAVLDDLNEGFRSLKKRSATQNNAQVDGSLVPHSRSKRGWGSIIFYGASILIRGTSLGLSIAGAVTEGCAYYKSICDDKDAIKRLDAEIQQKKKEYDREYVKSATEWVDLRDANTDNAYIAFYINETIRKVQTLSDLESKISDELELRIPGLFNRYQAAQNYTSEQFLQVLVGRLEYSLSDLKKMLEENKKNQLIGLAVQLLVEATLNKFITSYKNAYNQIRMATKEDVFGTSVWTALFSADATDAKIILDPNHPRYDEVMQKHGLKSSKIDFKGKVKLAPKVFGQMFQNTKKYFVDTGTGIKKWSRIKSWKGFKGKLKHSLSGPVAKLNKVKLFFTNSASRKFTVKSFKLGWSTKLMLGLGVIADAINTALTVAQWKQVADQMANARTTYETYLADLNNELANIAEEQRNISREWTDVISAFTDMSKSFKDLLDNVTKNADFADVMGLPRLPVSPNNPIITTNFDGLTRATVKGSQKNVIAFLRENDNNLTKLVDQMYARDTLYTSVNNKTAKKELVSEILSDLKTGIYNFNPSATVRDFGSKLTKKDLVCTISVLLRDTSKYDYYPLSLFRPRCDVNASIFTTFDQQASRERNLEIMNTVVKREIEKDGTISLPNLLSAVQNVYLVSKDSALVAFGNSITEQDIVCAVATQFPQMTDYDFISLSPFRPDCSAVSSTQFTTMKQNAAKLSTLTKNIKSDMDTCDSWMFCPCIPMMAGKYQATEADIRKAIKFVRPSLTQYCGSAHLSCSPACVSIP